MLKILRFMDKYKWKAIVGLLFKLVAAILELCIPMIMAQIVNNMNVMSTTRVLLFSGVIILIVIINMVFDLVCQRFSATCAAGIGQELRYALYSKVSTMSYPEIDIFGSGSLITRTTSDVTQVQTSVNMGIRLLSRAPFMAVGAMVMAAIIDIWMSLIFLAVIILAFLASYIIRKITIPMYKASQKKLDEVTIETKENLEGIRVSRAFNMQDSKTVDFTEVSVAYKKAVMRVNRISALLSPLTFLIINFAIFGVVWLGGKLVFDKVMLDGDILALVSYLSQVLIALNILSNLIVIFTKADASAIRIEEVLASKSDIEEISNAAVNPTDNYDNIVEMREVSFRYKNAGKESLQNINLVIKKGERIGIIGGTGQGKTTLINLLPRFYDATDGEILIGGRNIKEWNISALQKFVTIAPQNVALLSGSIDDNIRMGNIEISAQDVIAAANIAEAAEFINRLDDEYDHRVEQEGRNFSGGQRQRVSLARAFARNSELYIIDDSLSALDLVTDKKVRININKNLADKTVIIVSQRVSTLMDCDKIILMEQGRISAIGSHEELLVSSNIYREIFLSQSGL